jgi:hypothetical protein
MGSGTAAAREQKDTTKKGTHERESTKHGSSKKEQLPSAVSGVIQTGQEIPVATLDDKKRGKVAEMAVKSARKVSPSRTEGAP